MVVPEQMSLWELYSYIEHLSENRQETSRYEIVPVVEDYLPVRGFCDDGAGAAVRLFPGSRGGGKRQNLSGIMLGLGFHLLTGLFGHLGLLNAWPPLFSAIFPTLAFLGASVLMMWKVEKKIGLRMRIED